MAKCGLKKYERGCSKMLICVLERMRGLISSVIRISKQRVEIEKSRHRTIVTLDVQQIVALNHNVREEWEKKQAEAGKLQKEIEPEDNIGDDNDKEKAEGIMKSVEENKEEDDKIRTTAANSAARAATGEDDIFSEWQLMAEQARQKREKGTDVASHSQPGKNVNRRSLSTPTKNGRDHQEAVKRSQSTVPITPGAVRIVGRNQVAVLTRSPRSNTVKDVTTVLKREPQMSKSTVIYRLHEKIQSDAQAESS